MAYLPSHQARFSKLLSIISAATFAAGCATGYQPNGLTGGFEEAQVNQDSFRVHFRGNGYTSSNRAEELTLLRSAEICLEHGFPGFVLLRERTDVKNESIWLSNTTVRRGHVFSSGTDVAFSMPSTSNLVKCITEKPATVFSYDAVVLYESLTKKYEVPRSPMFSEWQTKPGVVSASVVHEPAAIPTRPPTPAEPPRSRDWQSIAATYARSIGCSTEPTNFSFTAQGAERYEFSCTAQPTLSMECWTVSGGCRKLKPN